MKIYILTDLEGVSGVVSFDEQTSPQGRYYEQAKRLLTGEVNAACEGAFQGGAEEVVILDGHGAGGLIFEEIHPEAKVILGHPLPLGWGLDSSYDAMFFVGQHPREGTERGVLCHTESHTAISNIWLNGELVGEFELNTAVAGHFGVPVVFLSGDEKACQQARELIPEIVTATVKWGLSRECAICLSPAKAQQLIREKAREAMGKIGEIKPYKLPSPVELRIEYTSTASASQKSLLPGVELIDPRTVRIMGEDIMEVFRRMMA